MPIGMPKSKSLNQHQLHQFTSFKVSDIEHRGVQQRTERSGIVWTDGLYDATSQIQGLHNGLLMLKSSRLLRDHLGIPGVAPWVTHVEVFQTFE